MGPLRSNTITQRCLLLTMWRMMRRAGNDTLPDFLTASGKGRSSYKIVGIWRAGRLIGVRKLKHD